MTDSKRVVAWVLVIAIGLAAAGAGVYLVVTDLDRADKLASVTGAFLSLVGLALSGYGFVLARRGRTSPSGPGGQTLERVDAGRGIDVVDGVTGSVRLDSSRPSQPGSGASGQPVMPGEQTVRDIRAGGHVRVIRGVGGDVDSAS